MNGSQLSILVNSVASKPQTENTQCVKKQNGNESKVSNMSTTPSKPIQIESKSIREPSYTYRGDYDEDLDIVDIHKHIREIFLYEYKVKLALLIESLNNERELIRSPQSLTKRIDSKCFIEGLEKEIERIKTGKERTEYTKLCKPILQSFISLGIRKKVVSFDSNGCTSHGTKDSDVKRCDDVRMKIIDQYLEIASSYITLELTRPIESINLCPQCNKQISREAEGQCLECGSELDLQVEAIQLEESNSNYQIDNITLGYQHRDEIADAKENFDTEFARYQGKKVGSALSADIFKKLDAYFVQLKMPTGAEVRMMPLNKDNRTRGETNKYLLIQALKNIDEEDAIDDDNYICKVYWGWQLPDVSHLEALVQQDYFNIQYMQKMFPDHRKSSLNVKFLRRKLLQRWGHECAHDDHKELQTPEIKLYHRDRYEWLCKKLGWGVPPDD